MVSPLNTTCPPCESISMFLFQLEASRIESASTSTGPWEEICTLSPANCSAPSSPADTSTSFAEVMIRPNALSNDSSPPAEYWRAPSCITPPDSSIERSLFHEVVKLMLCASITISLSADMCKLPAVINISRSSEPDSTTSFLDWSSRSVFESCVEMTSPENSIASTCTLPPGALIETG